MQTPGGYPPTGEDRAIRPLPSHQDQRSPVRSTLAQRRPGGVSFTPASTSATKTFSPTEATRGYLVPGQNIQLSALEDRESVRVALSVVINALATGSLDIERATALLHGLQLASNNASGLHTEPSANTIVRSIEPSTEGLDLAQPGALETDDLYHFNEDDDEEEEEEEEEEDDNEDRDISEESIEEQI